MEASAKTCWGIRIALVAVTLIPFAQVAQFGFLHFDDNEYVYENPNVMSPFSVETVRWAFASGQYNNWHPLAWLSHKLDYNLFGLRPGAHHAVNLLFHLLNTLLLFEILRRAAGREAIWKSAVVAALFAVHPLHVESVAWISERKDVLSTFFGLLALLAYIGFAKRPRVVFYLIALACFALSVMSKSMLVTLPCVLLLLDYWPLQRLGQPLVWRTVLRRIAEKIPFFAVAIAASLIAMHLKSDQQFAWHDRVVFTLVSYASYLAKAIWPFGLAAHYPFPHGALPLWKPLSAATLLIAISALALAQWRRRPHLTMGWFWFVGTLLPASGIVQVGNHMMADRYTYVPLIGLCIAAAWGVGDALARMRIPPRAIAALAGLWIAGLAAASAVQTHYWRDMRPLMSHAVRVTSNNCLALYDLGMMDLNEGRYDAALDRFQAALRTDANDDTLLANLLANQGVALSALGRYTDALPSFDAALAMDPEHLTAQLNRGVALTALGRLDEAVAQLSSAVRLSPDNADAHYNLALAYFKQDALDPAIKECIEALRLRPSYLEAAYCLGLCYEKQQRFNEAADIFTKILQVNPDHSGARKELARMGASAPAKP